MDDRELMQQALDALELNNTMHNIFVARLLRERLKQPDHLRDATKKVWVGLTDREITHAWENMGNGLGKHTSFARAIEAKLREKNGAA